MISTKKTVYKIAQKIASLESSLTASIAAITLSSLGIHISTSAPTNADGNDGDIWLKYEVPEE